MVDALGEEFTAEARRGEEMAKWQRAKMAKENGEELDRKGASGNWSGHFSLKGLWLVAGCGGRRRRRMTTRPGIWRARDVEPRRGSGGI